MESIRSTKLIELSDEILVEVEVPVSEAKQLDSASANRVGKASSRIMPILAKVANSLRNAIEEIQRTLCVENAEVEINLNFTTEGDVYITKLQSNANLKVKLILKPKVQSTVSMKHYGD